MARVTGCKSIFLSNPPSYKSLKKNIIIAPKIRGSVGKFRAAKLLNSIVRESGVKNTIKKMSLSREIKANSVIRMRAGNNGSMKISLAINTELMAMKVNSMP
jgi:hypothetical protein